MAVNELFCKYIEFKSLIINCEKCYEIGYKDCLFSFLGLELRKDFPGELKLGIKNLN